MKEYMRCKVCSTTLGLRRITKKEPRVYLCYTHYNSKARLIKDKLEKTNERI